jgi:hypothetical protein
MVKTTYNISSVELLTDIIMAGGFRCLQLVFFFRVVSRGIKIIHNKPLWSQENMLNVYQGPMVLW